MHAREVTFVSSNKIAVWLPGIWSMSRNSSSTQCKLTYFCHFIIMLVSELWRISIRHASAPNAFECFVYGWRQIDWATERETVKERDQERSREKIVSNTCMMCATIVNCVELMSKTRRCCHGDHFLIHAVFLCAAISFSSICIRFFLIFHCLSILE